MTKIYRSEELSPCCYIVSFIQISINYQLWIILRRQTNRNEICRRAMQDALTVPWYYLAESTPSCDYVLMLWLPLINKQAPSPPPTPTNSMTISRRSNTKHDRWSWRTMQHLVVFKSLFCCVLTDCVPQAPLLKHVEFIWTQNQCLVPERLPTKVSFRTHPPRRQWIGMGLIGLVVQPMKRILERFETWNRPVAMRGALLGYNTRAQAKRRPAQI